jgi:alanine dehydrogenase
VTVFDVNTGRLREIGQHLPAIATSLSEPESIAAAVASADVVIGAVLVAGSRAPHVVTREMIRSMRPGSVIIDVAIDEGGCVETSRPTSLVEPTFVCEGVTHCSARLRFADGASIKLLPDPMESFTIERRTVS